MRAANSAKTVLLAEDEEKMACLLKRVLSQGGYRIPIAADGHEAIDLFVVTRRRSTLWCSTSAYLKFAGWDVIRKPKETNPAVNIVVASPRMFQAGVNGYRQAIRCRRYHRGPCKLESNAAE